MQEHRNWLPSLSLYHVKVKYDVRRRTRRKGKAGSLYNNTMYSKQTSRGQMMLKISHRSEIFGSRETRGVRTYIALPRLKSVL